MPDDDETAPSAGPAPVGGELRARAQREHDDRVAARRALLELVPGGLRDLDAAAECPCECHPRPGVDAHAGAPCNCQLTEPERRERFARAMDALAEAQARTRPIREAHLQELADAAAELGIEVREEVAAAPWVLVGSMVGRGYYMRERWDRFQIVLAPDDNPTLDPWEAPPGTNTITIRTGTFEKLVPGLHLDYRRTLSFIANTIGEYLRRRSCPHPHAVGDRYCPRCGTPLAEPTQ